MFEFRSSPRQPSPPGGQAHGHGNSVSASAACPSPALVPPQRFILWEVNMARQCLENFSKVINAHAIVMSLLVTVTFVGFLQPPQGWNTSQNNSSLFSSPSVLAFVVFNSLSLFSAISGLLFYVYCSYSTLFTLSSVPIPERLDEQGMELVSTLRYILRRVAFPSVQRRSKVLFFFLSSSLVCCVAAYVCAGLAAIGHSKSLGVAVISPAVPGFIVIIGLLLISAAKMSMEVEFEERLKLFWEIVTRKFSIQTLDEKLMQAVDPMPKVLRKLTKIWETLERSKKVAPSSREASST